MILKFNEYAYQKRKVEEILHSHTIPIMEHLFKCLLMPNHESYNHWKKEIINQIIRVNKLSTTNKYPKANQIYDWTYGSWRDSVLDLKSLKTLIGELEFEYNISNKERINYLAKLLDNLCMSYFKLLSNNLSTMGRLDTIKANKLIDDYVKRYDLNVERHY